MVLADKCHCGRFSPLCWCSAWRMFIFDFYFVYVLMNGAAICRELCSDVWFCCFVWILMICVRQVSVNDMWELFLAFSRHHEDGGV